ncbi:hypothetical protein [Microvirga sp. 2TAF3]|uniref:hypothetical protein n=1 Tax=Microvirga sp. 2TAF3 TaxID=3233014 RepID=UPI003F9C63C0
MRIAFMAAVLASLAGPAQAQIALPETSRAEREVRGINRSLSQEQRFQQLQQQNQIDNNQLRQRFDRQQVFSNPSPPARFRNCPAGSVGC